MADDLGLNSFWPLEQNFSFSSTHYTKIGGDHFLDKDRATLSLQAGEYVQSDDTPKLGLDDVLMLDDIREFSMQNGLPVNTETNLYNDDDKLPAIQKSLPLPLKESFPSSHFEISPLKSPDDYLPGSPSGMSHSDTFQDLSIFMPQNTTAAVTDNSSFTANSYSTGNSFSDNSSSNSQFTNLHFTSETLSVVEGSSSTEFKSITANESSPDDKVTKCTELKIFKHTRHRDVRKKNNLASQRSRMTRKEREREMENKEKCLEQENQMLRIKVAKLEELTGALKRQLFSSFVGK